MNTPYNNLKKRLDKKQNVYNVSYSLRKNT